MVERILRVATAALFVAGSVAAVARAGDDDTTEPPLAIPTTTSTTSSFTSETAVLSPVTTRPRPARGDTTDTTSGRGAPGAPATTAPTAEASGSPSATAPPPARPTTTTAPPPSVREAGVYRVRPDGSGVDQVIPGGAVFPTWSRDSSSIAYGAPQLRISRADGTGSIAVIGLRLGAPPSWSPDSSRLAYVAETGGHFDLHVIGRAGGDDRLVASHDQVGEVSGVSWSPNGEPIAFIGGGKVWVVKSDGTDLRQISETSTSWRAVHFSPDGRKIAFIAGDTVMVVGLDGAGLHSVGGTDAREPAWDDISWSPDSTRIVFQAGTGGADRVRIVGHDGSGGRVLLEGAMSPSFAPDGRRVALFTAGPILGGGDRDQDIQLTNPDRSGFRQDVLADQQGAVQTWGPAYAPSGEWLLFAVGGTRAGGPPRPA